MEMTKAWIKEASKDKKIILDFYADWCAPCRIIKPTLHEIAAKNDDIEVIFINVEEHDKEMIKKQFGVKVIPNVQFWYEGLKRDMVIGNASNPQVLIDKTIRFKQI